MREDSCARPVISGLVGRTAGVEKAAGKCSLHRRRKSAERDFYAGNGRDAAKGLGLGGSRIAMLAGAAGRAFGPLTTRPAIACLGPPAAGGRGITRWRSGLCGPPRSQNDRTFKARSAAQLAALRLEALCRNSARRWRALARSGC